MSDLLSKAPFTGRVELLLVNPEPDRMGERHERQELKLEFTGPEGDYHVGHTRLSDSRMLKQFKRGKMGLEPGGLNQRVAIVVEAQPGQVFHDSGNEIGATPGGVDILDA